MPNDQPAPGSVRPFHRADVHIIEPQGSELYIYIWLDVKIYTVAPELSVAKELFREEQSKCRAYGQRDGCNFQALQKGMTPVRLEQYGRTPPGAQAIFEQDHQPTPPAPCPTRNAIFSRQKGPIFCTLLRAAWQAHAECAPKIGPADLGNTPPSLPDSPGELE